MNLQTQRRIDRWIGQPLCAAVSLWARLTGDRLRAQPASVRNVLVIMLSEMGSMVLAGPMFAQLRAHYPGATVHVLQLAKNREVSLLLGIARPEHLHAIDDSSLFALMASMWRVLRALRRLPIDVVLDCELFSRISALLSYACGAPLRAGFTPHTQEGLYRGSFFNRALPYNPYRHITLQFVALVDALRDGAYSRAMPRSKLSLLQTLPEESGLRVDFAENELASYARRLKADFEPLTQRRLVLLYTGGGILPERAWPAAHYAELARALCADGHAVGLIGLADDRALAQQIRAECASAFCFDLTGYTRSIRELLMLFHQAALLVTNDGGPGHFASLTPVPTFMFFGPETARLYGPLSPRTTVFDLQLPCSPCLSAYNHRQTFCDGDNQCLKRIAPERVIGMARQALALAP